MARPTDWEMSATEKSVSYAHRSQRRGTPRLGVEGIHGRTRVGLEAEQDRDVGKSTSRGFRGKEQVRQGKQA